MKLKKKIFSVIIAVLMLANLVMPTMAQTITSNTFSGTVALDGSTKQTADLSNIDIKIYSLAVAYTDPTSGQNDYSDTYVSTVTTNKNGAFSFTKPSVYYKIEIDLSSLPTGYGVDKYRCIYENGQSNDTFTLYPIHNAEMVMETVYDAPEVVFTASNGQRIYRDYEINLSNESTRSVSSPNVDILATTQATFAGNISGNEQYSFSKTFDLSKLSSLEKVDFYAKTNMITEEQKIHQYCCLVENKDFVAGSCLNHVLNEIACYASSNKRNLSNAEYSRLIEYSGIPDLDDYPNKVENSYFIIRYQDNLTQYQANTIAQLFLNYRNNLIALGFNTPLPDQYYHLIGLSDDEIETAPANTKLNVFITGDDKGQTLGTTWGINEAANVCESIIAIYNIHNKTPNEESTIHTAAETIAHEYFHAVQNAYQYSYASTGEWFSEACASWYSIYMENAEVSTAHINRYFALSIFKQPIYTQDAMYAKALFPLTIDIAYGGYTTIRYIYQYLSSYNNYSFTTLKSAVDYGIAANNRTGTFNDVFKTFAVYNSDPNYYYGSRIPYEDEETSTYYMWNNTNFQGDYINTTSNPYGILYLEISPPLADYTYTVNGTISMTNSFSSGAVSVAKICKTASGTYNSSYLTANNRSFSIYETALGSNTAKKLYYAIINMEIVDVDDNGVNDANYATSDFIFSPN